VILRALALLRLAEGARPRIAKFARLTAEAIREIGHRLQVGCAERALYDKQRSKAREVPGTLAVLRQQQVARMR